MNDCPNVPGETERLRFKRMMNADALSAGERAYLLGLYFSDGCVRWCSRSTQELIFGFQLDEGAIADRVVELFRRCGLNPRVYFPKRANMIEIRVIATNIVSLFAEKEGVSSLSDHVGLRWVVANGLELPFLAGLVDGDGTATAKLTYSKGSIFGKVEVQTTFSQCVFPFLVDFVHEYVNSLCPGGAALPDPDSKSGDEMRRVFILVSGRDALIRGGVAGWSFKFVRLVSKLRELNRAVADLKSRFLTVGEVARRLHLGYVTVWRWCKKGLIKCMWFGSRFSKSKVYRHIIPIEEVQRLEAELSEESRMRRVEREGMKLVDVAKMLGFTYAALCWRYRQGKLRASLVHGGRGVGSTYLVVAREEVDRLREEKRGGEMTEKAISDGRVVRLADAAKMLRVSAQTLHKWYQRGKVRATMASGGRSRAPKYLLIPRDEVERLMAERGGSAK